MLRRCFGRLMALILVLAIAAWSVGCEEPTPGVGLSVLAPYGSYTADAPWTNVVWPGGPSTR